MKIYIQSHFGTRYVGLTLANLQHICAMTRLGPASDGSRTPLSHLEDLLRARGLNGTLPRQATVLGSELMAWLHRLKLIDVGWTRWAETPKEEHLAAIMLLLEAREERVA